MLERNRKSWRKNKEVYIWIFDVGRGFSSFIKTPDNYGMIIDCGCGERIHPFQEIIEPHLLRFTDSIQNKRLAQVIVTHPHCDHCLEIETVLEKADPYLLTTPHSNEKESDQNQHVNWSLISNPSYGSGSVTRLKEAINKRTPPLHEFTNDFGDLAPGFELRIFFIPPKFCEIKLPNDDYGNNLSIVTYLKLGNNSILFPGDLLPSGCEYLIKTNKTFCEILSHGISVLVAPHHGLESGFYSPLYDLLPNRSVHNAIIISDKRKSKNTDGTTHQRYLSGKLSGGYRGRYSFSTNNDGHIRIILGAGNKIAIDASKSIDDLI